MVGKCSTYLPRGVLDFLNFDCFASSRRELYHCNAMGTSVCAPVNWHKIHEIEHTPANQMRSYNSNLTETLMCATHLEGIYKDTKNQVD